MYLKIKDLFETEQNSDIEVEAVCIYIYSGLVTTFYICDGGIYKTLSQYDINNPKFNYVNPKFREGIRMTNQDDKYLFTYYDVVYYFSDTYNRIANFVKDNLSDNMYEENFSDLNMDYINDL